MQDLSSILSCLREGPAILKGLLLQIPEEDYKKRRIPGKWTIHEHACHLDVVQDMIIARFKTFRDEKEPKFKAYLPGKNVSDADLIKMDLSESVESFARKRKELLVLLDTYTIEIWNKKGSHPQYREFTPYIFLRHVMMHDHFHMYRMEELWLTKEDYL